VADKHANVEFDELLSALACGEANRDQMNRLHLLLNEPQLRQRYVEWANLESTLYWEHGGALRRKSDPESGGPAGQEAITRLSHTAGGSDDTAPAPTPRRKSWLDRAGWNPGLPALGIAMVIFVSLLLGLALIPMSKRVASDGKKDAESRQPHDSPESEYVAILNNRHKAVWLGDPPPSVGDPRMKPGRKLKLASGMIEVKYYTGARVVIEGPAEFYVGGTEAEGTKAQREGLANSGFLKLGKLVARVHGKKADGFTIDTPTGRVEDHGTEFGVEVDGVGASEFVVLSGKVDVIREAADGSVAQRITLTKNEGAFIEARGGTITKHENVDVRLVAAMRSRLATTQRGIWSASPWVDDSSLPLSASTTYTHAIDIQPGTEGTLAATTIGDVNFTQYGAGSFDTSSKSGTDLASGKAWSATAVTGDIFSHDENFTATAPSGTDSDILTNGAFLVTDGGSYDLTLSGLSANTDYIFTVYGAMYDAGPRSANLDGLDDGVGTNVLSLTEDNTLRSYAYNTGGSTTFTMRFTGTGSNWNLPAFTNELVTSEVNPTHESRKPKRDNNITPNRKRL
jgi:hypothetical protein